MSEDDRSSPISRQISQADLDAAVAEVLAAERRRPGLAGIILLIIGAISGFVVGLLLGLAV